MGFSPAANPRAIRSASTGRAEVRGSRRMINTMEAVGAQLDPQERRYVNARKRSQPFTIFESTTNPQ